MKDHKKLEPLILLEDEPVAGFKDDQLGIEPFARVIAGTAVGTSGPFTIGVFANWGEGKTSLLKQAKSLVDEYHPEIVTVWFNAWQFEKEEHPIVPLVASIVRAVDLKLASPEKRSEKFKIALSSVSRALRAIAYGFSANAKVTVPGFADVEAGFVAKEMIDRYDKLKSDGDPLLDRTLYYNAFETLERVAGEELKGADAIKIVVFIDDLDRCLPPQALKLLESIKLVLTQRGFIFALAVDRRVLESFIAARYIHDYKIDDFEGSGTQYLDKIVQLPLDLPSHRARFAEYIEKLLEGSVFQHESNEQVREAVSQLGDVLATGSNYNPRSLVRFLNNLIVDRQIWLSVLLQQGVTDAESQIDAKRLGLCAVSRILRQHLGDSLYLWLVVNEKVCEQVADGKLEPQTRKKEALLATLHEQSMTKLARLLEEQSFLRELLRTEPGKSWLTDHEARQVVDEFIVQQREEPPEKEVQRRSLVSQALKGVESGLRWTALQALAENWQDDRTRKLLEERAVQDEQGDLRAAALQALAEKWPDDKTRKLLEERAVQDEDEFPRHVALHLLAQKWPDETVRKRLAERAIDPELNHLWRGEYCVALGKMHSEFGRILFTEDLDGLEPHLDPARPVPHDHIRRAAEKANVPPDKIDEIVRSLSKHMGWDITKGSAK